MNGANSFILYGKGGEIATNDLENQELTMLAIAKLALAIEEDCPSQRVSCLLLEYIALCNRTVVHVMFPTAKPKAKSVWRLIGIRKAECTGQTIGKALPVPSKSKNPVLAACLSLVPGIGHLYLRQNWKALAIVLFLIITLGHGIVALPLIVVDAYVLARRTRRGQTLRAWEWFWSSAAKPQLAVWKLAEIRKAGRTEQPIGSDSKVLDNSRSDGSLKRSLEVTREWSYQYSVDHEQARKVVDTKTLQIKDGPSKTLSIENALRQKYSYSENARQTYKENVEVDVPARRKITIYFHWKNILETGVIVLTNQYSETVDVPYSIVTGVTFDQENIDSTFTT